MKEYPVGQHVDEPVANEYPVGQYDSQVEIAGTRKSPEEHDETHVEVAVTKY